MEDWIVSLSDITDDVKQMKSALDSGERAAVVSSLPQERIYPTPDDIVERLFASQTT